MPSMKVYTTIHLWPSNHMYHVNMFFNHSFDVIWYKFPCYITLYEFVLTTFVLCTEFKPFKLKTWKEISRSVCKQWLVDSDSDSSSDWSEQTHARFGRCLPSRLTRLLWPSSKYCASPASWWRDTSCNISARSHPTAIYRCWNIWKEGNKLVLKQKSLPEAELFSLIKQDSIFATYCASWLNNGDNEPPPQPDLFFLYFISFGFSGTRSLLYVNNLLTLLWNAKAVQLLLPQKK